MRRFHFTLALLMLVASCGPGVPGDVQEPGREPGEQGTTRIAGDPGPQVEPEPTPPQLRPYDAPPHVFSPRSHPPRHRYGDPAPPNLRSLPRLKMKYNKCFGGAEDRKTSQIATSRRKSKRKGGTRSAPPTKKPRIPGRAKSRSIGTGNIADVLGGGDVGSDQGDLLSQVSGASASKSESKAPPPAPSAPAPSAQPTPESAPSEAPMARPSSQDADRSMAIAADEKAAEPTDDVAEIAVGEELSDYEDWGAAIYLSNDDTMSLSSAQRVVYAIDNFLPLPLEHIRPHELLNYFSFETATVEQGKDFSVLGDIAPDPREESIYSLGLAVRGRPVDKGSRRNAAITLVIDRSGSMRDEGRMNYLRRGLERMLNELKTGDMLHMVLFDHNVCVPVENFVVGRDNEKELKRVINALRPRGSTDLHRGLTRGYEIADQRYRSEYTNRVVMITDAMTNTGVTNQQMISMISKYFDSRRIRLSGVGVGRNFNDALLDKLTERGKGAYVFLGSAAEVDAVFGSHFVSLIETTANDVHFRLHLPPSLRMNVFYGEESSTVKADVQEIHYFAGTSQLFLSDLMARGGKLRHQDEVMLSIEYKDPETNEELLEEYAFNLGELTRRTRNVKKARMIMTWIDMLAQMAARPVPPSYRRGGQAGGLEDAEGWGKCEDGKSELARLSSDVKNDPEIRRIQELWEKYCARYERPRNPVKRQIVAPNDSWPSAKPNNRR
ncbi:MAG: VWA domain-containing protein [Deltaproteobacteria bacterium]|nr:VWA domain-containing protein [Deltaproteobacteria bacterium]